MADDEVAALVSIRGLTVVQLPLTALVYIARSLTMALECAKQAVRTLDSCLVTGPYKLTLMIPCL